MRKLISTKTCKVWRQNFQNTFSNSFHILCLRFELCCFMLKVTQNSNWNCCVWCWQKSNSKLNLVCLFKIEVGFKFLIFNVLIRLVLTTYFLSFFIYLCIYLFIYFTDWLTDWLTGWLVDWLAAVSATNVKSDRFLFPLNFWTFLFTRCMKTKTTDFI